MKLTEKLNGFIGPLAVGIGLLALGGAFTVWGQQSSIKTDAKNTKSAAKECCATANSNAVAIGKITEWIKIDRNRTEREYREGAEAHKEINRKLDEIQRHQANRGR